MKKVLVVLFVAGILAAAFLAQGASADPPCHTTGCTIGDGSHYG